MFSIYTTHLLYLLRYAAHFLYNPVCVGQTPFGRMACRVKVMEPSLVARKKNIMFINRTVFSQFLTTERSKRKSFGICEKYSYFLWVCLLNTRTIRLTGKPYIREKLSTVNLLVLNCLDQLFLILQKLFTFVQKGI